MTDELRSSWTVTGMYVFAFDIGCHVMQVNKKACFVSAQFDWVNLLGAAFLKPSIQMSWCGSEEKLGCFCGRKNSRFTFLPKYQ